jgi:nucleotide-binding universal stress UspA family protein
MLLGSVSQAVLQHSCAPVLVVPRPVAAGAPHR